MLGMTLIFTTSLLRTQGMLSCYRCAKGIKFLQDKNTYLTPTSEKCDDELTRCSQTERSCVYGLVSFEIPYNGLQFALTGCYEEFFPGEVQKCFSGVGENVDQRTLLHANYCLCFDSKCNGRDFRHFAIQQRFVTPLLVTKGVVTYYTLLHQSDSNTNTASSTVKSDLKASKLGSKPFTASDTETTLAPSIVETGDKTVLVNSGTNFLILYSSFIWQAVAYQLAVSVIVGYEII